jgi:hypothetical protein
MMIVRSASRAGTIVFGFINRIDALLEKTGFTMFVMTTAIVTFAAGFGMVRGKPGKMRNSIVVVMGYNTMG